jgi:hypothetical protein
VACTAAWCSMKAILHAVPAVVVIGAFALANAAPDRYDAMMQEDRAVEWATVVLFGVAGIVRCYVALRSKRVFDFLVGIFCVFVAGEEISWGQRLIGYTPPGVFLEHNTQQEANIHNFADVFGRPKWMLVAALAGYGLLLPTLQRAASTRRLLDRIGAAPPTLSIAAWIAVVIALLIWYPLTFTGEWAELIAGWLFVASAPLSSRTVGVTTLAAIPAALAMTWLSAIRRPSDAAQLVCAQSEVNALVEDIVLGNAGTPELDAMTSVHKRLWGSVESGYIDDELLRRYRTVSCQGESAGGATTRRRYIVDPWGTAYWLDARRQENADAHDVVVYSFGPNRRRDDGPGDDVRAEGVLR